MFRVFFVNFGWFSQSEAPGLDGALEIAKAACFQSTIFDPSGELVAFWCPLMGTRRY